MAIKLNGIEKMNAEQRLKYMLVLLEGQLSSESDELANISNAMALIKALVEDLNWAGVYLMKNEELVLGPFQGLPACNRIKLQNGVCGAAATRRNTMLVPNVEEFEGHIACDSASKSELVVPIIKDDIVYGVLDLDSPSLNRFTDLEKNYMEKFVDKLNEYINWERFL
ncbi:GAF domain-containing protein [Acetoanaerobium pronyense]|uniref:GAF domain-containing protein n=1 Tax=Acetoanaerobium pronyense TaxID=1482736 RepID=A0ABS4KL70_9FIRM|nr:GAF domain-containing protein [Acetoanaerobium pronyense]MBP2027886.1 GAF domain-containing protein [Acetoanaerobium pronyense]